MQLCTCATTVSFLEGVHVCERITRLGMRLALTRCDNNYRLLSVRKCLGFLVTSALMLKYIYSTWRVLNFLRLYLLGEHCGDT